MRRRRGQDRSSGQDDYVAIADTPRHGLHLRLLKASNKVDFDASYIRDGAKQFQASATFSHDPAMSHVLATGLSLYTRKLLYLLCTQLRRQHLSDRVDSCEYLKSKMSRRKKTEFIVAVHVCI
jgi:hypothetical protein